MNLYERLMQKRKEIRAELFRVLVGDNKIVNGGKIVKLIEDFIINYVDEHDDEYNHEVHED